MLNAGRAVLVVALLLAGCTGDEGPELPSLGASEEEPAELSGMSVSGDGPVLSWTPVEGAVEYAVAVSPEDGPSWVWTGSTSEVTFGAFPESIGIDALAEATSTEAPTSVVPVQDVVYTWSVLAFDESGSILAASPSAGFVCTETSCSSAP